MLEDYKGISSINTSDTFKSQDLGINIGLAYGFKFGLSINARCYLGLTSIVKEDYVSSINTLSNIGFGVSAG